MDFIFNEFSFRDPFVDLHGSRMGMVNLLKVCKYGRELGMSRLAIRPDFYEKFLTAEYKVSDWLNDQEVSKVLKDLLLSIVRHPYINDNDTAVEDRYILSSAFLMDNETEKAEGLAVAYLYKTVSISLYSSEKWNTNEINLIFSEEGYDDQTVKVKHASQVPHLEGHKSWIVSRVGIKLRTTNLLPNEKKIHLSGDHHGNHLLMRFSRKLLRSSFVTEVINSMPFNPYDREFIKNCYQDGRIEIVLVRSDQGFGVVVQTTGDNIDSTEAISEILLEEFQDEY